MDLEENPKTFNNSLIHSSNNNNFYSNQGESFLLTNRSLIESLPEKSSSEIEATDMKYLYFLTGGGTISYSDLKKKLGVFLTKSFHIFSDMRAISDYDLNNNEKINYQNNLRLNNSLYKKISFNNKIKCFSNNIEIFNKKLEFLKERKEDTKKLFDYIKALRNYKFILDEKVDIGPNDTFLDLSKIILQYKTIQNFSKLINIDNKNFSIEKKYQKNIGIYNYELKSDFYDAFNKDYELYFEFKIELDSDWTFYINNDIFDKYLLNENFNTDKENNFNKLVNFYIKYLIYKFSKEEIKQIKRCLNKDHKTETSFELNGLMFLIIKYPNVINIKCSYMDNIVVYFNIYKLEKTENKKIIENSYMKTREKMEIKDLKTMNNYHTTKFILTFFGNLVYNVKLSKKINAFVFDVVRNKNLVLENLIKNTIVVNNLKNISLIFLRDIANQEIIRESKEMSNLLYGYRVSVSNNIFSDLQTLGEYHFFIEVKNAQTAYKNFYYSIDLFFDKDLKLTIKIKEPYRNNILSLDKNQTIQVDKGRINLNYLYDILRQYLN